MKNAVFWDVTPCGSCKNRRFGGKHQILHGLKDLSSVGTATAYRLDDRWGGVRVPVESRMPLLHAVQTVSGAVAVSCPMGNGGSIRGVKLTTHFQLTPMCAASPPYVFMVSR
jgi:hypothetical protein